MQLGENRNPQLSWSGVPAEAKVTRIVVYRSRRAVISGESQPGG